MMSKDELIKELGNSVVFIPERVKLTNLKQIPKTKCWEISGTKKGVFSLFVNMRTGQRLVLLYGKGIFDIGVN